MQQYPKSIRNLVRQFSRLPGIGEKTAERLAMHVLKSPADQARALAESIVQVKRSVRHCRQCFGLSDGPVCQICQDQARDRGLVCVVEQPADMMSIEKAGCFKGLYHILGGALSPMDGIGPDQLRLEQLWRRVDSGQVREVILATSTSVEGEATASFIVQRLAGKQVRVSRIASGVPMGGDIKYVDQMTLKRAIEGRHACR